MKKRLLSTISILLMLMIICLMFGGCSFKIQQIDNLIRPPMLQGDYHGLQEAFELSVGKDIILKSPVSGNYRSAFILYNIDDDEAKEALVFYINRVDKTTAHVNILDNNGKEWVSIADFAGSGSDVDSVSFADMNSDNIPEIVVSWGLYESKGNKILTIFGCSKTNDRITVKALSSEAFTVMEPIDIDSDGNIEIFIVMLDTTSDLPKAFAKMLKMQKDGTISLASQINLDGNVGSYADIKTEKVSENDPLRIYIDANKGEMQMITEVVYWDKKSNSLVAPLLDKETQSNMVTWRSVRIPSMDINNDGIIEIPMQSIMPGSQTVQSKDSDSMLFYLTNWLQIHSDGTAVEVMHSAINFTDNYMLVLPSDLYNKIAIQSFADSKRWEIYKTNGKASSLGAELFSIFSTSDANWFNSNNSYIKLIENNNSTIGVNITAAGKSFGIDVKFLKKYLVVYKGG